MKVAAIVAGKPAAFLLDCDIDGIWTADVITRDGRTAGQFGSEEDAKVWMRSEWRRLGARNAR